MKRVQSVGKNKLSFFVSHYFKAMGTFVFQEFVLLKSFQLLFLYMKVTLYMLYNSPKP